MCAPTKASIQVNYFLRRGLTGIRLRGRMRADWEGRGISSTASALRDQLSARGISDERSQTREGSAMNALACLRRSEESDSSVSLKTQAERIAAWCRVNGDRLTAAFTDDDVSRQRRLDLPGLQAAIKEVCRSKSALVAYSLSQLTRPIRETRVIAERAERAGADLAFLSERVDTAGTTGKRVFRVLALLRQRRNRRL